MTNAHWLALGYALGLGMLLGYPLLGWWRVRCAATRFRAARERRRLVPITRRTGNQALARPRPASHAGTHAG